MWIYSPPYAPYYVYVNLKWQFGLMRKMLCMKQNIPIFMEAAHALYFNNIIKEAQQWACGARGGNEGDRWGR